MNYELDKIPKHIAIIMDGNGRWATQRGKDRSFGHQAGVESVHKITSECTRLGVKWLTLYTFSTENWNRPIEEVQALMGLLMTSLEEEIFMKNNVRLQVIGDMQRVPKDVREKIEETIEHTAKNDSMTLVIALSYSSKWELTKAVKNIVGDVQQGKLTVNDINEDLINTYLETAHMPDPDLLIRTGGDFRISNFLLWEIAYSELYFTPKYWPDFQKTDFCEAIIDYQSRQRRFGLTGDQILNSEK